MKHSREIPLLATTVGLRPSSGDDALGEDISYEMVSMSLRTQNTEIAFRLHPRSLLCAAQNSARVPLSDPSFSYLSATLQHPLQTIRQCLGFFVSRKCRGRLDILPSRDLLLVLGKRKYVLRPAATLNVPKIRNSSRLGSGMLTERSS